MKYIRDLEETAGIHCKTEDEAKAILKLAHEAGFVWTNGKKYIQDTYWSAYEENTVYFIKRGTKGHYSEYGGLRAIYPASDFLEESTETNIFMFKKISDTKWLTNKIQGVHLIATYLCDSETWKCSLSDKNELFATEILKGCSSIEDVCLCLEHNQNPLHDMSWEDGFCVDYETSSYSITGLPTNVHSSNGVACLINVSTLSGTSSNFKKIENLTTQSQELPQVHVPKKFKSFSF